MMRRAEDGKLQIAYGFVVTIKRTPPRLRYADICHCGNGRQSAIAAELIAQAGVPHVFLVRGGMQGELSESWNDETGNKNEASGCFRLVTGQSAAVPYLAGFVTVFICRVTTV